MPKCRILSSFHISDVLLRQFSKDTGPYRWFNTEIKMGGSTTDSSGGKRFYLRSKTGILSCFQRVIAAPWRNKEGSLSHKGIFLTAPSSIKVSSLPCREKGVCGRLPLPWKGLVQEGRCCAMVPSSLRPKMARKRGGRWGEPGSSALSGYSSGWGPCRSHRSCARAPGELNPGAA